MEHPKPRATLVNNLDQSSQLPDNSESQLELVLSDASFGVSQLSIVDELPDGEDNTSSRLDKIKQKRMHKRKQYMEEEVKMDDINLSHA